MPPARRLLLVNPWITDVAAYDLWAWPLGLLYLAGWLRQSGFEIRLVDCMDRAHPSLEGTGPKSRAFNTGHYQSEPFDPQPEPARRACRIFRRYGIAPGAFEADLDACESEWGARPDAVLVTSRMTYWYHGVSDAVSRCRTRWPEVPVVLGGIYATLCPGHARASSGATEVFEGVAGPTFVKWLARQFPEMADLLGGLSSYPDAWPAPALDLCHSHSSLPIMTSLGCPYRCSYCASGQLSPVFHQRPPDSVWREIASAHEQWQTRDYAFYDDALLVDSEHHLEPLLDRVIEADRGLRFHTPNGLHYGLLNERLAAKMKRAGVETIRLSLETVRSSRLAQWGRGGDREAFVRAVGALRVEGYARSQIGVYIMAGMPDQTIDEVREAIEAVHAAGATPKLNEYSPIPGTKEWDRAVALSGREIENEPLWQNNSLYYTRPESTMSRQAFEELKRLARRG